MALIGRHLLQSSAPPGGGVDAPLNCTPNVVDAFPLRFFSDDERRGGLIVINITICLYTFAALAIICHEYFVPALEKITKVCGLEANVAGATVMAGGASFPQLATSIISVFLVRSDIGVGTIGGSAFFNILFVLGVCGLVAPVIYLHWWPMVRDTSAYILAAIVLTIVLLDEKIYWYESLFMVLCYSMYILALVFNKTLLACATVVVDWIKRTLCCCPEGRCAMCKPDEEKTVLVDGPLGDKPEEVHYQTNSITDLSNHDKQMEGSMIESDEKDHKQNVPRLDVDDDYRSIMHPPSVAWKLVLWIVLLPVITPVFILIPDCRRPGCWRRFYGLTFIMSIILIGCASYILVWMLSIIGDTAGMPATVIGMTLLAAGDSIPDLLNAVFVARDGFGDMAMSNCIGSNIFDILICLGLPWLLDASTADIGQPVVIYENLTYITLCLLTSAIIVLLCTYANGWKLDKKLGIVFIIGYFVFTVLNSVYDFHVSLPICS